MLRLPLMRWTCPCRRLRQLGTTVIGERLSSPVSAQAPTDDSASVRTCRRGRHPGWEALVRHARAQGADRLGGMGTFIAADHSVTCNKQVAVKVLNAQLALTEDLVSRLHNEAQLASSFSSPHHRRGLRCRLDRGWSSLLEMELFVGESLAPADSPLFGAIRGRYAADWRATGDGSICSAMKAACCTERHQARKHRFCARGTMGTLWNCSTLASPKLCGINDETATDPHRGHPGNTI